MQYSHRSNRLRQTQAVHSHRQAHRVQMMVTLATFQHLPANIFYKCQLIRYVHLHSIHSIAVRANFRIFLLFSDVCFDAVQYTSTIDIRRDSTRN